MIILIVAGYPDSILRFRGELISSLVCLGFTVHVAAPNLSNKSDIRYDLEAKGLVVHDIPLHRVGLNPIHDFGTFLSLFRLIRQIRPNYILSYTIKPVIYGSLAAMLAGVPNRFALITGLGYAFQSDIKYNYNRRLIQFVAKFLYSIALRGSKKVFFQNPDDERLFRDLKIILPRTPSTVINGSGVDTAYYNLMPLPDDLNFLLIARLLGNKGVREFAAAAARVHRRYPSIVFSVAGWIDAGPDAIKKAELDYWVRNGSVTYLGHLRDVRQAISACSVYVLPSYREGTPRTVLEAMAMGRAIITTDTPGCRETVIHGDNGFLIPVKSVDDLERAMLIFIENKNLAEKMGARSREIAEKKYDVHKVNSIILSEMNIR